MMSNRKKMIKSLLEDMMQEDKKVDYMFYLSAGSLIFLLLLIFSNPELTEVFLVKSILLMAATSSTSYYGYLKMLQGRSRELFSNNNINIKGKDICKCFIDAIRFNMQILHSFLVMVIAVTASLLSLYGLYTTAGSVDSQKIIPLAISMISLATGLILATIIINYEWYIKHNKLIDLISIETKNTEEIKQSNTESK